MSLSGSDSPRALAAPLAIAATALGVAAMMAGPLLAYRFGFGTRSLVALGEVLLALPALAALATRPSAGRAAVGGGLVSLRAGALSVLLGAALWVGSIGLMELQSLVYPPSPETLDLFRRIHAALAPTGFLDGLLSLAVIALLPALCEELVMRGVLLPSLVPWTGGGLGVFLTAAVFSAVHYDLVRLLFTFVLGLLLGLVRLRTRSLVPPVLVHATLNALTFAIAPLVDDPAQPYTPQPALGLACLAAGALVAWPLLRAIGTSVDSPEGDA